MKFISEFDHFFRIEQKRKIVSDTKAVFELPALFSVNVFNVMSCNGKAISMNDFEQTLIF